MNCTIFEKQNNFLKTALFLVSLGLFVFSSCVFKTPDDFVKPETSSTETETESQKNKKTFYKVSGSADVFGAVVSTGSTTTETDSTITETSSIITETSSTTTSLRAKRSNLINDITSSARTAVPYTTSIKYFVTATNSSTKATVTSGDFDLGTDFSLDLYSATWTLTATAYYSSDTEKTSIMSGSESVTVESSDIADISIELLPTTSGTGTVALNFGFSKTHISYATASWTIASKSYSKKITSGTVASFDLIPDSDSANTYTEVPSGAHQVVFVFYDTSDEPKYRLVQTINVFDGMTTNSWQSNSNEEYIDTTNNQIFVTDEMVTAFASKICYVSSSGSDSGDGSFFAPYATIQKAVDKAVSANDGTSTYTIYLLSDITATDDDFTTDSTNGNSLIVISPSSTFNLTIEPFEKSSATINANRSLTSSTTGRIFYIGENANVTLKNLVLTGGYSDGDGGAIYVAGTSSNSPKLMLSNCEIGKTNDSISALTDGTQNTTYSPDSTTSSNSSVNGGAIYATYAKVILDGTKILNNYATLDGGGIYISNTTLTINKDSEIYANGATAKSRGSTPTASSSISANDSSTIELYGKIHHHYSSTLYVSSGIYLSSSSLNMYSGAEICDNYSAESYYPSGVYLSDENSKLNATGGSIKNNSYSGSSIYNFDVFYTGTAADITLGGEVYIETIYSLSAPINVSSTLNSLSDSKTTKIYTTITNGNTVLQATATNVSFSDCVDFFELYGTDYQKSSSYELKLDTSETLQKLVISELSYETVYLDPTNGDDTNKGKSYAVPVKTLEVAVSRLNKNATNPTIYVMNNISVSDDESSENYWTFDLSDSKPKVTLKRYDGTDGGSAFTDSILTVASGGIVNATGIIFDGNSSVKGTAPLVDVESGGTLTLNNCYVQNNVCSVNGGGIYNKGTTTLSNSTVSKNTSARGGGVCNSGTFVMYGTSVIGDSTATEAATSTSYSNYASTSGGGICNFEEGTIYIGYTEADTSKSDSTFSGGVYYNYESNKNYGGGGIYNAGTAYIYGGAFGKIAYNYAASGGGIYNVSGTLTLIDCIISSNKAKQGGGLTNYSGIFVMSGSSVIGDKDATTTATSTSYSNYADNGGGIYTYRGTMYIGYTEADIAKIDSNFSGGVYYNYGSVGGGIFSGTGTAYIYGGISGKIAYNYAVSGGGIYNEYGDYTLTDITLSGNTSSSYGSGIYNRDRLTMNGSAIVDSTNDVYLYTEKYIAIGSTLTGTTPVATITPSSYATGTQVLSGDSDLLSENYTKFALSDTSTYTIASDGTLQYQQDSSGLLTVKINDNISLSLSSSTLSTTEETKLTLTATVDGTQVTTSNTNATLYNGGVTYADTSVKTSVSADNTITVSGAVAPGSYQLLVTFTYDGTEYQATFDLTAADSD